MIEYLAFTISECHESIDLNYLLAFHLESEGRIDEAKQQYRHCLELNSAHHYARMKMELLGLK